MAHYRCYFLMSPTFWLGATRSFDTRHEFHAATDAAACEIATDLYHSQRNGHHGFELWQSDRLVFRDVPASSNEAPARSLISTPTRGTAS